MKEEFQKEETLELAPQLTIGVLFKGNGPWQRSGVGS
jgi:hypothetical protein